MTKKILFPAILFAVVLSGCGKEISTVESALSENTVSTSEESFDDITEESIPESNSYTSLGITVEDVSAKINRKFSSPSEYTFQTEQFDITLIINLWHDDVYTQQCVIYTALDSDDVLCVRFMDTHEVLVKNDSASQSISECIDSVISLLDIPESGYISTECIDKNFDYSYCIYPVDVDSTVLLQPQSFELPIDSSQDSATTESPSTSDVPSTPATSEVPSASETSEAPSTSETAKVTTGQKNALKQAKQYLKFTHFSYLGLVKQLEFEGYTHDEAIYAVDNCGADWNEQALKKALDYLDISPFSYSGLIEQLKFEDFTAEQATYAADNCGADWNKQAADKAASYLSIMSFSRDALIKQLEFEGFTHDQAVYGVEANGY